MSRRAGGRVLIGRAVASLAATPIVPNRLRTDRLEELSTLEAVRAASLRVLETRREAGRTAHSVHWGALVAAGA